MKILISEFSSFFKNFLEFISNFHRIFRRYFLIWNRKKGVLYLHRTRRAEMARGTRANATWYARPRGSATRTQVQRWPERVARPCESTQTPGWHHVVVWGGWQVKAPQVSGPWLDSWGTNARALFRPTLYTWVLWIFSPCGTMFHVLFCLQDTCQRHRHWMNMHQMMCVDAVDSGSTRSPSEHVL